MSCDVLFLLGQLSLTISPRYTYVGEARGVSGVVVEMHVGASVISISVQPGIEMIVFVEKQVSITIGDSTTVKTLQTDILQLIAGIKSGIERLCLPVKSVCCTEKEITKNSDDDS
jgi:hypothetical protein